MVIQRLLAIEAEIHTGNKSRTITTTNFRHLLTPHDTLRSVAILPGLVFFHFTKLRFNSEKE